MIDMADGRDSFVQKGQWTDNFNSPDLCALCQT